MGIAARWKPIFNNVMSFRKQMRIEAMMKLRRKALALAVTAAVVGGGVSVAQAQSVAINAGSLGQALVYPYLTSLGGWNSFLHVTNTSSATVAAKVRFRAAADSADAYDFILVLSPYDMWTGVVEQQNGLVGFRPTDSTCTVPYFGKGTFTPFIVQSPEVYAEVILMGVSIGLSSSANPVAVAAKHTTAGVPASCSTVEAAFANPSSVSGATEFSLPLNGATIGSGSNTIAANMLTGKYDLTNVGLGQSGAGRAVAIANFFPTGGTFINTGMWSQSPGDWDHPTLAEGTAGLSTLNTALNKTALINEWVLNPNLGELSEWTVTFPTKKLYVDAITPINAISTQSSKLTPFGSTATPNCVTVTPSIFNREEKQLVGASPGTSSLCNEANVIAFKNGSVNSSSVLGSAVAVTVDTTLLGTTGVLAGWMNLAMPTTQLQGGLGNTTLPSFSTTTTLATAGSSPGRPAVGFNLTSRATPDDAVLYDHAYLP